MPPKAIWQAVRLALIALLLSCVPALTSSCGSDDETQRPKRKPSADGGLDGSKPDGARPDGSPGADANPNCGNGVVDPGEDCDDGNDVTGDGCEPSTCKFTCVPGAAGDDFCNDFQHCNGQETCSENHVCVPGEPRPNGEVCGQSKVCKDGTCEDAPHTCGDRILVIGIEECDDGNLIDGDGCNSDCRFSCVTGDATRDCAAADPCAGKGVCNDSTHVCGTPTPLPDNTECGNALRCRGGVCSPITCGNSMPDPGEECDDGNTVPRDGCENGCRFSCLSTDATRNCAIPEPCDGTSTCNDSTHTCSTPTPLQDRAVCGMNRYCSSHTCILAVCGNGSPEPTEQCDDGNTTETDGCTTQCKYTCQANSDCSDSNDCTSDVCATSTHTCSSTIDTTKNGQACTINNNPGTCRNGDCVLAGCGNGIVDAGEECDTGATNGTGAGCTSNCQFECDTDDDCTDNNACNGAEACAIVAGGKKCQPGTPLREGDECATGPRRICNANLVCVLSQCGDLHVDSVIGEQCDDGNTNENDGCKNDCHFGCQNDQGCSDGNACNGTETCATVSGGKLCRPGTPLQTGQVCQATPRSICTSTGACVQSRCGDLFVDTGAGEQCDDGDTDPADGCKNDCTFTCTSNPNCSDSNTCTLDQCNTTLHTCSNPVDTTKNGQPCTSGTTSGTCQGASCVPAQCGNSIVDIGAGEECDRGTQNGQAGSGCTASCQFECDTTANCDDGNACNGDETCVAVTGGRRCQTGSARTKGTVCQASPRKICDADGGSCVSSICGDGLVDSANGGTEECDKGSQNGQPTSGCTATCRFACHTDPDCDDENNCNGVETCQTVTGGGGKTCRTGTAMTPGAVCLASPRRICSSALDCVLSTCGDGFVDTVASGGTEECDKASQNGQVSSGCTQTCQFYCDTANDCNDGNNCNGVESCQTVTGGGGKNCQTGTPLGLGDVCQPTPRSICNAGGSCVPSLCGDSFVDGASKGGSEECDKGNQNGVALSGCTSGCLYQCHSPADCPDTEPCNGTLSCSPVTGGQTCTNGAIPPNGTVCGSNPRKICKAQACSTSTCGDQFLDNQNGGTEQCEPPNTTTCTSGCQSQCDLAGTWALRLNVTVSWPATAVLDAGTGPVRAWARVVRTQSSSTAIVDSGKPCGIEVPDFRGSALAGAELYGIQFPNTLFDNANTIQASTVSGTLTNSQVGASFTTPAFATLIGLTMAAPVTDAWPLPASIMQRDDDVDSQFGVTTNAKSGGSYFAPPIEPFKVFRADQLFLAVRQVVSLSGSLTDCSTMSGNAAFSKQDVAVLGCHVAASGTPGLFCDATQRDFLHNNSPVFTMPASGTFSMKKLAAGATCANVRTQLP